MKRWTIYCHTHTESGRRYIGLTGQTMEQRWKNHINVAKNSKGGRWHFPNAIRKYGPDAFEHKIVRVFDNLGDANLAEKCLIKRWKTRDHRFGFNLAHGGLHVPHQIRKNPWDCPEYREKMTEVARKKAADPVFRAKVSASHIGVKLSPEHCAGISKARMGKDHAPEVRARINRSIKITYSKPEIKNQHSHTSKKWWTDPDYRAKVTRHSSEALRKKWSIETPSRWAETITHKICQKHGLILKSDCFKRVRAGRTYFECRECYRVRNNVAYHNRRAQAINTNM